MSNTPRDNDNRTVNTKSLTDPDFKGTMRSTRPEVVRGTNAADSKPRIWKSGSSQVEDK